MIVNKLTGKLLGAPFGNTTWSQRMRSLNIPNTNYRFACFTPTTSKFVSEVSCGIQSYITLGGQDYREFDPVYLGTSLLWTAKHLYTSGSNSSSDGFHWIFSEGTNDYNIDRLAGGPLIRKGIDSGLSPDEIRERWMGGLEEFREKRNRYLLY